MSKKIGRPSSFTQKVADAICERLADGESLRKICADEDMPYRSVVFRWLGSNEAFQAQYARARDAQADALADDIVAIADEDPLLAFSTEGRGSKEVDVVRVDGAAVAHQRNRIEARKWIAAKLKPKKYGDKVEQTHVGPDGGAVTHEVTWKVVKPDGN